MDVDLQESITVKGIWREILDRTNTGDYKTAEDLLLQHLKDELNIFGIVWIFRLFKNAETLAKWTAIEDLVLSFISKNNIALEESLSAQITHLISKWIKNQKNPDKVIEEVDYLRQNFASTDHERIWLLVLMYHMTPFRSALKTQRAEEMMQLEPNNAYFKYVRAYHEEQFQRVESAIELYREAIDLNPYFVDAMINLGNCYNSIQQYEDAVDWYDRALLNREDVDAIMNKAIALSNNMRPDNALQTIEELLQKEPSEEALLVKVSIWKRIDERDLALNEFDNVIKLYPNSSNALMEKAIYLARLYREEEGFLLMDRAAEINPKNTKVLLERAEYYANYGNQEKAVEIIDEIIAQPDLNSAKVHFCKAKVLEDMTKYDEAIKEIDIAINMENDETADYYFKMGLIYVQQNKFRLAEISFKKSADLLPTSETYWELAKIKENTGYYYESLDYYNLALKEDPLNILVASARNWMRTRIAQDEDKETL